MSLNQTYLIFPVSLSSHLATYIFCGSQTTPFQLPGGTGSIFGEVEDDVFFAWAIFPFAALRMVATSGEKAAGLGSPVGNFQLLPIHFGDGEFGFEFFPFDFAVCC